MSQCQNRQKATTSKLIWERLQSPPQGWFRDSKLIPAGLFKPADKWWCAAKSVMTSFTTHTAQASPLALALKTGYNCLQACHWREKKKKIIENKSSIRVSSRWSFRITGSSDAVMFFSPWLTLPMVQLLHKHRKWSVYNHLQLPSSLQRFLEKKVRL